MMFRVYPAKDGTYTIYIVINDLEYWVGSNYQSEAAAIDTILSKMMELINVSNPKANNS